MDNTPVYRTVCCPEPRPKYATPTLSFFLVATIWKSDWNQSKGLYSLKVNLKSTNAPYLLQAHTHPLLYV